MSSLRDLLDQRVAWIASELDQVLEHEHELSHQAREALLAVCNDACGALERAKLERTRPQSSGPEEGGP